MRKRREEERQTILFVSQCKHKFMARLCILLDLESSLSWSIDLFSASLSEGETHFLHTTTETIIRQTRNHNIKCWATLHFPLLQQRQNPASLEEIPRPAMHEQQRDCVLGRGFLVQEVDVQFSEAVYCNFGHELR